jgi:hypothetical protein
MAVAQDANAVFHAKQPLFGRRQKIAPRQKVAGNRLQMAIAQVPPRAKNFGGSFGGSFAGGRLGRRLCGFESGIAPRNDCRLLPL